MFLDLLSVVNNSIGIFHVALMEKESVSVSFIILLKGFEFLSSYHSLVQFQVTALEGLMLITG